MNKEPIGLYIFRFVFGFALFAFMGMLYWSSTLIENDLRLLRGDLLQLKNDLFTLRIDAERARSETLQALLNQQKEWQNLMRQGAFNSTPGASLPPQTTTTDLAYNSENNNQNLLNNDIFLDQTLPKLLGKDFVPHGIQHTATIGKPNNLHPFTNWLQVATWQGLCGVAVAKTQFGKFETMAPDMALKMEERTNPKTGVPEFWVFLRDHVYWQPLKSEDFSNAIELAPQFLRKHQVTAEDYKFYFDAMMNPFVQEPGAVALRNYYGAIEEIEVIDKLTFVVRWKAEKVPSASGQEILKIKYVAQQLTGGLRPLASFVYKYFANGKKIVENDQNPDTYRTDSTWAQNFAQHWAKNVIVSCGAWIFDGMNERQIKFKRNSDFYFKDAALTEAIEIDLKDSPDNIWEAFKNNRLDSYALQPQQLLEFQQFINSPIYAKQAEEGNAIERLDYIARSYAYIGWNEARPFFQNPRVRQAMTMAIDRKRIIEQNLNGMGIEISCPFYRYSSSYDDSIVPLPFQPDQAKRLLQEEGWYDSDGDGIIDKLIDGQRVPFQFTLTYYVKNPTTKAICEYVSTTLKNIGIECRLNGVDIADLSSVFDDKNFDAVCMAWSLGSPPEDPRQLWHSSGAKEKGSSNAVGFVNAEIDQIIDELDYEYDRQKRKALYFRFDQIMHEQQPYTLLYTPKTALLYRQYLQNVFIPVERPDLVPGANIAEPDSSIFWIDKQES